MFKNVRTNASSNRSQGGPSFLAISYRPTQISSYQRTCDTRAYTDLALIESKRRGIAKALTRT